MGMKNKIFSYLRRPVALLLAFVMVFSMIQVAGITSVHAAEAAHHAPDSSVNDTRVADPSTMMGYQGKLLSSSDSAANSRYAGRLWGDKSVFARGKEGSGEDGVSWDGNTLVVDSKSITSDGDFLTAASMMGSSMAYNIDIPVNMTIVIDNSGSMYNNVSSWDGTRIAITVESVNRAIDRLMMDHPDNMVSVVLFGDGGNTSSEDTDTTHSYKGHNTAVTILPMKHYTPDQDVQEAYQAAEDKSSVENYTKYLLAGWPNTNGSNDADGTKLNHTTVKGMGWVFVDNQTCDLMKYDGDKEGYNGSGEHQYTAYANGTTNIQAGLYEGMKEILDAEKTYQFRDDTDEVYRIPVLAILTDGAVTDSLDNWLNPSRDEVLDVLNKEMGFVNDFGHPGTSFVRHNDLRGTHSDHTNAAWNQFMLVESTDEGKSAKDAEAEGNVTYELYASAENKENAGKVEFAHDTYTDHPEINDSSSNNSRESTAATGGSLDAMQELAKQYRDDQSYSVLTYLLTAAYYKLAVKNAYHLTNDWNVYTISVDMPDPSIEGFTAGFSGTVNDDARITTNPAMMDPGKYFNEKWLKDAGYLTDDGTFYDKWTAGEGVIYGIKDAVEMWQKWNAGQDTGLTTYRAIQGGSSFYDNVFDGEEKTRFSKTKGYTAEDLVYTPASVGPDGENPSQEQVEAWTTRDQAKLIGNNYTTYTGTAFPYPGHGSYCRVYGAQPVTIPSLSDAQLAAQEVGFSFTSLDYDYVTEAYYVSTGSSGGSTIASAFDKILDQMTQPLFAPVGGSDAFGAADSVTYVDPIGLYMEVKNDAMTVDGMGADMGLYLFGEMHPMEAAAIYRPDGKYTESDPAIHLTKGQLIEYLPTLDMADEKVNSTVYTFYRCQHNSGGRYTDDDEVSNPCYQTDAATASGKPIGRDVKYKFSDIRVWTEDTGSYVDEDYSVLPGNNFDQVLCINVPVNALPMEYALVTGYTDLSLTYSDNLNEVLSNGAKEASPLRLYYSVGMRDEILTADGSDVDIAKLSDEYLEEHKVNGQVEFRANHWSKTEYDGYADAAGRNYSRGDAVMSFSPASDNRYYLYQKPLILYKNAYVKQGGSLQPVSVSDSSWEGGQLYGVYDDISAANAASVPEGQYVFLKTDRITSYSADLSSSHLFMAIDYYARTTDTYGSDSSAPSGSYKAHEVNWVIARKGSEFGSQLAGSGVGAGSIVCWYNEASNEWVDFVMGSSGNGNTNDGVLATKPGGLRVGDMSQSITAKSENKASAAENVSVPVVNQSSVMDDDHANFIIDMYLGNNGRMLVNDGLLAVTKEVEGEEDSKETFNYTINIAGKNGSYSAVKLEKHLDHWDYLIDSVTVRLSDNDEILKPDGTPTVIKVNSSAPGYDGAQHTFTIKAGDGNPGYTSDRVGEDGHTQFFLPASSVESGASGDVVLWETAKNGDSDLANKNKYANEYWIDAIYQTESIVFDSGNASFTLSANQGLLFAGMDPGTEYSVKETITQEQLNKGYDLQSVEHHMGTSKTYEKNSENDDSFTSASTPGEFYEYTVSGFLRSGNTAGEPDGVHWTNSMKLSSLTVGKKLQDTSGTEDGLTDADKSVKFTFGVTLTEPVGGQPLAGPYKYTVYTADGEPDPAQTDQDLTLEGGKGTFQLQAGQKIEIKGLPVGTGYAYELQEYPADGFEFGGEHPDGKASGTVAEGTLEDQLVTFTNVKKDPEPATVQLTLTKTVDDQVGAFGLAFPWAEHFFTFKLTATGEENPESDPLADGRTYQTSDGTGFTSTIDLFDGVEFTEPGTYVYTVAETHEAVDEWAGHMAYDTAVYTVTVTVSDDTGADGTYTGKLKAETSIQKDGQPGESVAFTNVYTPETVASLPVKKQLEGRHLGDGEFEFKLTPGSVEYNIPQQDEESVDTYSLSITMPALENTEQEFTFDYTLTRPDTGGLEVISATPSDASYPDSGTFVLKSGETKTFEGLPVNTQYSITLQPVDGYQFAFGTDGVLTGSVTDKDVVVGGDSMAEGYVQFDVMLQPMAESEAPPEPMTDPAQIPETSTPPEPPVNPEIDPGMTGPAIGDPVVDGPSLEEPAPEASDDVSSGDAEQSGEGMTEPVTDPGTESTPEEVPDTEASIDVSSGDMEQSGESQTEPVSESEPAGVMEVPAPETEIQPATILSLITFGKPAILSSALLPTLEDDWYDLMSLTPEQIQALPQTAPMPGDDPASPSGMEKTVRNAADGTVTFGNITFKYPGTYHYTLQEVIPEPRDESITHYDDTIYDVTVVVEVDEEAHGLKVTGVVFEVQVQGPDGGKAGEAVFVNTAEHTDPHKTEVTPGDDEPVRVGDTIEYRIDYQNYESTTSTVIIKDTLDMGLDYVEGSASTGGVYDRTARTVTWMIPNVEAHGKGYVTFKATVNEHALVEVENTATVQVGDNPVFQTETVENPVPHKTSDPVSGTPVEVGKVITYTITFKNTKDEPMTIKVRDSLDKGLTYQEGTAKAYIGPVGSGVEQPDAAGVFTPSTWNEAFPTQLDWTILNVPAGSEGYVVFQAMVNEQAVKKVENTAYVAFGDEDYIQTETVEHPIPDPEEPHKTEVTPGDHKGVQVGDEITYQITYQNNHLDAAKITVTDTLDAGLDYVDGSASDNGTYDAATRTLTWVIEDVPSGSSGSVTFTAKVNESAQVRVENTAYVEVNNGGKVQTETVENPVEEPKKEAVNPPEGEMVKVGQEITYRISAKNNHEEPIDIVIRDPLDSQLDYVSSSPEGSYDSGSHAVTWTFEGVPAGEERSVTLTVKVNSTALVQVENTAYVSFDHEPEVQTDTIEHPLEPEGEPHKTEVTPGDGETVKIGDQITYRVSYVNNTLETADIVIRDPLDVGNTFVSATDGGMYDAASHTVIWTIKSVPSRGTGYVDLVVQVNEKAETKHRVDNTAYVKVGNKPEQQTETVSNPEGDPHKTELTPGSGKTVKVGDEITYQITYVNNTFETADIIVRDPLDKGVDFVSASNGGAYDAATHTVTWTIRGQASGAAGTVTLTVKVNENAAIRVDNTAYVKVGNNPEQQTETVSNPEGEPHKTEVTPGDGKTVNIGDSITYQITYVNNTFETADIIIRDPLDVGNTFVSASNGGAYDAVKHEVTWTIPGVAAGATGTVTLTVRVNENAEVKHRVDNTAYVQVGNNPEQQTETVHNPEGGPHKTEVTPGDGKTVKVGDEITYQISYVNNTLETADITIRDPLDKGNTFMSASDGGAYDAASHTVTWKIANVAPGVSGKVTLTVKVNSNAVTKVDNTAYVKVGNNPEQQTETVTNPIGNPGSLQVVKTVTGNAGDTNREWHFTVTLDPRLTGTYGEMTFTNGVATFTLKHGKSITATNLPEGTKYIVVESDANVDGYHSTWEGAVGTIPAGGTAKASFVNRLDRNPDIPQPELGSLTVTKTVSGYGDTNTMFNFTVTIDPVVNGTYGGMTFTNGKATFQLKHGQSVTASGLPAGSRYTVTETEANQNGYITTVTNGTGTIQKNATVQVTFRNDKPDNPGIPTPEETRLVITKEVTGVGDTEREWHFTITLDPKLSGTYGDRTFTNGVCEFTLKHGQFITIAGLPVGTKYTVTEAEANQDGYTTTVENGTGTANGAITVKFVNDLKDTGKPSDPPKTGDETNLALWVTLLLASIAGMTALGVITIRKRRKTK